jgi:hypothetical protein
MRFSNGNSAPSTPTVTKEAESIHAMFEAEELHRQKMLEKQAAEAGESRWVLSVKEPEPVKTAYFQIVQASWADIDRADRTKSDDEDLVVDGRIKYGKVCSKIWT